MTVAPEQVIVDRINSLSVAGAALDITQAYIRKELSSIILADIDMYALRTYNDGFRNHLGASLIGADCVRATWYSWRWMVYPNPSGRMQRLWQRGHLEEHRFIEYLRGIGFEVWEQDPATGKQFRVSRLQGHFGGSLDSILRPPAWYKTGDLLFLGEFKTKGTGGGFNKLKQDGIMLTNPQHYDQMCTYGAAYGYTHSVYFTVNKNDDDMHVEIVPLNHARAAEVESKAAYIIAQQTPPPKLSLADTHFKCKTCDYLAVCHHNALPAKNCRSCQYSRPVEDAAWYCDGHRSVIPADVIATGCPQWTPIPSPPR